MNAMPTPLVPSAKPASRVDDELDLLAELVPLVGRQAVELGCGAARLARALLARFPDSRVTGVEVDARQHAKNLAEPQAGLRFVSGVAQAIPLPDASFDLALMLKSLHHVPVPMMATALREVARVLYPGGLLYVSEPVFAGPLNELVRLFNDEQLVRAEAQAALDQALMTGTWVQLVDHRFEMPVHFADFDSFERQVMRPTFADHQIDAALAAQVHAAFNRAAGPDGLNAMRPMHVRLLRRQA